MKEKRSDRIKAMVMCYWRFHGCPILATEYPWGNSDVVAVTEKGRIIETEVKISISDLRHDLKKPKHHDLREAYDRPGAETETPAMPRLFSYSPQFRLDVKVHRFFFAVPVDIAERAEAVVRELFPYAGMLVVNDCWEGKLLRNVDVVCRKHPKDYNIPVVNDGERLNMIRGMGTALCKIAVAASKPRTEEKKQ